MLTPVAPDRLKELHAEYLETLEQRTGGNGSEEMGRGAQKPGGGDGGEEDEALDHDPSRGRRARRK